MVKNENEENNNGSSGSSGGSSEGGVHSNEMEYKSLLDQYRTAALAFDIEIDKLVALGKDIDKADLASMVIKKVALDKAETSLALCLTIKIRDENVQQQQEALRQERKNIIALRARREKKEEELKTKLKNLGKEDSLANFFLPGRWLDEYKDRQVKDVVALTKEVTKLDKVIESKLSKLPPAEREKLEIETKEALGGAGKETFVAKTAQVQTKQTTQVVKDTKVPIALGTKAKATEIGKITKVIEYHTSPSKSAVKPQLTPEQEKVMEQKKIAEKGTETGRVRRLGEDQGTEGTV